MIGCQTSKFTGMSNIINCTSENEIQMHLPALTVNNFVPLARAELIKAEDIALQKVHHNRETL